MGTMVYSYGGVDALILLGGLRDLAVNRRIHTVYLIGLPLLVAGQAAAVHILRHRPASGYGSLTNYSANGTCRECKPPNREKREAP